MRGISGGWTGLSQSAQKKDSELNCSKSFNIKVPKRGLEPPRGLPPLAPQASASANSATWAHL